MAEGNKKRGMSRHPLVISFLSGKGGAGKTSVSLGMAKLLYGLGYRVLFVDLDLHTHGASYFFTDICEAQHKTGILELMKETKQTDLRKESTSLDSIIVKLAENWDFVPSKKIFKERTWELLKDFSLVSMVTDRYIGHFRKLDYDFIIIDTQAGPAISTLEACKHSSKVVIVSEPDPISVAASRSLEYEIHEVLPEFTRFLVNKLNTEEVQSFRAIKDYLTIFEHVSPLPFDFGVRKAFSLRKVPIDTNNPSPFLFGLIRLCKEIIPTASKRLYDLENKVKKLVFGEISEKRDKHTRLIEALSNRIREMRDEQIRHDAMFRKKTAVTLSVAMATITALVTILFIGYTTKISIFKSSNISTILIVVIGLGILASMFPILFEQLRSKVTFRRRKLDLEIESIQERLQALKREKEKIDGILLERSERFMIESE